MAQNTGDVLIFAPIIDFVTTISHEYASRINNKLLEKGFSVKMFTNFFTNPLVGLRVIRKYDPVVILYGGHGFEDAWVGDNFFWYFLTPSRNLSVLKDKILYAIPVCLNGQILAPEVLKKGRASTMFASVDYMYAAFREEEHDYLEDFYRHWESLVMPLFEGRSTQDCYTNYIRYGNKLKQLYQIKSQEWPNASFYIDYLQDNIDGMQLFGDPNIRLEIA